MRQAKAIYKAMNRITQDDLDTDWTLVARKEKRKALRDYRYLFWMLIIMSGAYILISLLLWNIDVPTEKEELIVYIVISTVFVGIVTFLFVWMKKKVHAILNAEMYSKSVFLIRTESMGRMGIKVLFGELLPDGNIVPRAFYTNNGPIQLKPFIRCGTILEVMKIDDKYCYIGIKK